MNLDIVSGCAAFLTFHRALTSYSWQAGEQNQPDFNECIPVVAATSCEMYSLGTGVYS